MEVRYRGLFFLDFGGQNGAKIDPKTFQNGALFRALFEDRFGGSKIIENVAKMSPSWAPFGLKKRRKWELEKYIEKSSKTETRCIMDFGGSAAEAGALLELDIEVKDCLI